MCRCRVIKHEVSHRGCVLAIFYPVLDIGNGLGSYGAAGVNKAWIHNLQVEETFVFDNDFFIGSSGRKTRVDNLDFDD